jgi:hypothetical protein
MTLSATTTTREAMASLDVFHRTLAEMMVEKGLLVLVDGDPDQGSRSGPETLITQCQGR